ncbi:class I SAM-dependent RNA methyltransferase [Ornithinimicrobium humiphilum]|uniref:23S rRNA m(5)U-1939 methyltransferase n=1 Tax=Ornithinimicrobium humiphilum TaxID=125288 RepID=A0A543KNC9_9MICO|nr:TRAM domain-containing protein [Ornithinimicrobium humiphilum]TQM96577.1 23S rRNA m(5)U-1939 methyltransferase [Ornithinimicrobium humiphilum]
MTTGPAVPEVGDVLTVTVGPVAHGGFCVARREEDGLVLFVRHTLPGEIVRATVTETGSRFVRADATEVLEASPARVVPPCPFSGPGRCGGCDWQHASLEEQRRLKAQVVQGQLRRLAGLVLDDVACEPVPGDVDGLRWRTRVEFAVTRDDAGERVPGLRLHRSHEVLPVTDCLIADERIARSGVLGAPVPDGVVGVDVVAPGRGEAVVVPLGMPRAPSRDRRRGHRGGPGQPGRDHRRGRREPAPVPLGPVPEVTERVGDHEFTLSARGFWQVHPGAATTFTDQVLAWLDPQPGERALDLYAGVGLFAVPLAERVGLTGSVRAVEADREAAAAAERHLTSYPWARAVAKPTEAALADLVAAGERADVVVLDPPRTGAGRAVVEAVAALSPRAVVYVACDPAALARDVGTAREHGLELVDLRVLDAFPMTHHMECLALLRPVR